MIGEGPPLRVQGGEFSFQVVCGETSPGTTRHIFFPDSLFSPQTRQSVPSLAASQGKGDLWLICKRAHTLLALLLSLPSLSPFLDLSCILASCAAALRGSFGGHTPCHIHKQTNHYAPYKTIVACTWHAFLAFCYSDFLPCSGRSWRDQTVGFPEAFTTACKVLSQSSLEERIDSIRAITLIHHCPRFIVLFIYTQSNFLRKLPRLTYQVACSGTLRRVNC